MKHPDPFTPFFLPWRARLGALGRSLPRLDGPRPFLHRLEVLFARWLPPHTLCPTEEGPCSRQRQWPLRLTFWTFLAQVLSPGSACRAAVRQAQAQARLEGRPVPADEDSAYCQARLRLPQEFLPECVQRVGRVLEQGVSQAQRWCGHRVKVLDATTLTAEDTPANQKAFPQHPDQAPGCGFPLLRLAGLFCLASGALLGWATGDYWQSEMALAALSRRRWQVELSFRQIKTALSMEHLAVRSPEMIARSLAMHLLAYQLIRGLMQEAAQSWDVPLERVSFQGAVDGARHFGEAMLRARSRRTRQALLAELLRILAADAVPERPGRREPRALKRRPKRYPRLDRPRRQYREPPQRHRRAHSPKPSNA